MAQLLQKDYLSSEYLDVKLSLDVWSSLPFHRLVDRIHGCQMAIAKFLECMHLALQAWWTMAPLRYTAKFDPFLPLHCAGVESGGRKESNFAIQQPWIGRWERRKGALPCLRLLPFSAAGEVVHSFFSFGERATGLTTLYHYLNSWWSNIVRTDSTP